jgi:asparagine synthase (glutamine-hydrolysing)
MCGIAGIIRSEPIDPAHEDGNIRRMLGAIKHRGPDQFGIYSDQIASLGSARLSIIDVAKGRQPICNEDGTLWIVFNGEIFNFVELRPELKRRGHRFTTNTDTEVLLHAFEEFGADCLQYVNGQFAVAIWNSLTRELFLARDRMGIRPLFYTQTSDGLFFASEVKALLALPGIVAEIDPVALDEVFVYWGTLPGGTIFRGIREVLPGHYLTCRAGGEVTLRQYWDLSFAGAEDGKGFEAQVGELVEELRELLTDAVRIRLRSDVRVGAYLSGGLDSSVISAVTAAESSSELATFSIAFEDPVFDESAFQFKMAQRLHTKHEVVRIQGRDIANCFPDVIWHTETPVTRTAPAPMFLLSRLVRDRNFKVVMTGEGADEVLAGYDIFKELAIRRFWARRPESATRPLLLRRLYDDIPHFTDTSLSVLSAFFGRGMLSDSPLYSHSVRWRNNSRLRRFYNNSLLQVVQRGDENIAAQLPPQFSSWHSLQRAQYLESKIFLSQYLLSSQGDRMGMAHSVESRMPFLDYRVVEFCGRLSPAMKLRVLTDKYLLRRMAEQMLPQEVWQRPKRPYRAPVHHCFFGDSAAEYVNDMLSPRELQASGLFNPAAVARLKAKAEKGMPLGETDDMALVGILSTQLLHHQFVTHARREEPLRKDDPRLAVCPPQGFHRAEASRTTASGLSTSMSIEATLNFSRRWMQVNAPAETERITSFLIQAARKTFRRRGAVVGISGGVDSSLVLALCARAFGADNVRAIIMPERESDPASRLLAEQLAERFGVTTVVEDLTQTLESSGCYRRRDDAIRRVFPEYDAAQGYRAKLTLPQNLLDEDTLNVFSLVVLRPDGLQVEKTLGPAEFRQIEASSNLKQRTRMATLYYHAELNNYVVVGTANKDEHDMGFFVKNGDGGVDIQPLAHLFKMQVYQLAEFLGIPEAIRLRTPTTDTYSAPASQEEFFFRLPFETLDPLWFALENSVPLSAVSRAMGLSETKIKRAYRDFESKHRSTEYLRTQPLLLAGDPALAPDKPVNSQSVFSR